jgi:hypothetical protein
LGHKFWSKFSAAFGVGLKSTLPAKLVINNDFGQKIVSCFGQEYILHRIRDFLRKKCVVLKTQCHFLHQQEVFLAKKTPKFFGENIF